MCSKKQSRWDPSFAMPHPWRNLKLDRTYHKGTDGTKTPVHIKRRTGWRAGLSICMREQRAEPTITRAGASPRRRTPSSGGASLLCRGTERRSGVQRRRRRRGWRERMPRRSQEQRIPSEGHRNDAAHPNAKSMIAWCVGTRADTVSLSLLLMTLLPR